MIRGTVINIHFHGALVRLEDGSLASVEAPEVAAHRPQYVRSLERREPLVFVLDPSRFADLTAPLLGQQLEAGRATGQGPILPLISGKAHP